jgi:hypothetical protein
MHTQSQLSLTLESVMKAAGMPRSLFAKIVEILTGICINELYNVLANADCGYIVTNGYIAYRKYNEQGRLRIRNGV